jgi:hypothetical protein
MKTLGKVVVIGVFAVVVTSVVWTAFFIATGTRLTQNMTTLVALASLGIGLYGRSWLAARQGQAATPAVAETAAKADEEHAEKPTKETKRKGRGRRRKN